MSTKFDIKRLLSLPTILLAVSIVLYAVLYVIYRVLIGMTFGFDIEHLFQIFISIVMNTVLTGLLLAQTVLTIKKHRIPWLFCVYNVLAFLAIIGDLYFSFEGILILLQGLIAAFWCVDGFMKFKFVRISTILVPVHIGLSLLNILIRLIYLVTNLDYLFHRPLYLIASIINIVFLGIVRLLVPAAIFFYLRKVKTVVETPDSVLAAEEAENRLVELQQLYQTGQITEEEYSFKKAIILNDLHM